MRKRLTARSVRAESRADGVFPGDVGNEEREKNYHDIGEYTSYEHQEGWDIPVKEKSWEEDRRDETGFGIQRTINAYRRARDAALLAQLLLGEDASMDDLQKQACDFIKLGHPRIIAALRRWRTADQEQRKLMKQELECGKDEPNVTQEACKSAGENKDETVVPAAESPAEETVTAAPADTPAPAPAPASAQADAGKAAPAASTADAPADVPADVGAADDAAAPAENRQAEDADFGEVSDEEKEDEAQTEFQLNIPPAAEDGAPNMFAAEGELNQAEPDPALERLFSGDAPAEDEPETSTASNRKAAKQGIKHLAGQPKLASGQDSLGIKELEGIWSGIKLPGLY